MPRSSQRHNREIYGVDSAGETPEQHGEIGNVPSPGGGGEPVAFQPYTESWAGLSIGNPIGGAVTALDPAGNWVSTTSPDVTWSDLQKAPNTPAGTGYIYFADHDTPGVWGYYRLAMQNTAKQQLPDYVKITFNLYQLLGQTASIYIYNTKGAYEGLNNGDQNPTVPGDPGYLLLQWNGSTEQGPYLRLYQSEEGVAGNVNDYDVGPLTLVPYDTVATITFETRNNGGQRQYRCTMDYGNIDSGWFDVSSNILDLSEMQLFLQLSPKNHQATAFLGNVTVEGHPG